MTTTPEPLFHLRSHGDLSEADLLKLATPAEPPEVRMSITGPCEAVWEAQRNLENSLSGWQIVRETTNGSIGMSEIVAVLTDHDRPFTAYDRWGDGWMPPVEKASQISALPKEVIALWNEYAVMYSDAKEHAGNLIWQSMKSGPPGNHIAGRPDWNFESRDRPGSFFWTNGKESVHSSFPRDEPWNQP